MNDSCVRRSVAFISCLLWLLSGSIITVTAAELPGSVQPGQIEKQFKPEPKIRTGQPQRHFVPEVDPRFAHDKDVRFRLKKVLIEGATVYSESALRPAYEKYLDREVSLSDIHQIAAVLTAKYRNDGYILSRVIVPVQTVESGEVRLKAIEGYVEKYTIEGAEGDRRRLVERYAEKIRKDRPLRNSVMERNLLFMNDIPGAFARATIKASPSEPAASEMLIQVTQQKVQGGLSADNRGGETLGPMRLSGDIALNSVLGLQENTFLRYVTSGNRKMNFLMLSHDEILSASGDRLNLSFSGVESELDEVDFIPLNYVTSSRTASVTYSHALVRSRAENFNVRANFTAYEGKTELFGTEYTKDRIRAVRFGATYDRADYWLGNNLLDIELSQGIHGLGSSDNNDPTHSRPNGKVDFTKVAMYAARLQGITSHVSLLAAVTGQYAFSDLLSSELFSFGGEQFGRGYDPSELVGDTGVAGKLELRFTNTLPLRFSFEYTAYAFYDIGVVHQRSPGDLPSSESAASGGGGLRFAIGPYVYAYVECAKPLTRDVAAEQNRDPRFYGAISIRY